MKIYLTICHDRHIDDDITAHRTLIKARKYIEDWIKSYDGKYVWTKEDDYTDDNWICTVSSDVDDGPHGRIEMSQLEK